MCDSLSVTVRVICILLVNGLCFDFFGFQLFSTSKLRTRTTMENPSLLHDNLASYCRLEANSLDLESFKLLLCDLFTDFEAAKSDNDADKAKEEKIKFLFDLFDQDKDGRLNESETKFMWSNWVEKLQSNLKFALVIVDMQNDFIGGSLAVSNAADCLPVINRLIGQIKFDKLVYTLDSHPADHISFFKNINSCQVEEVNGEQQFDREAIRMFDKVKIRLDDGTIVEQILWPVHCVRDSDGEKLHKDLIVVDKSVQVRKGESKNYDSYSAFFDNLKGNKTEMDDRLKEIDVLFITGVALDYCVGATTVDALGLGYATVLVEDACRGIAAKSIEQTKLELQSKGCIFATSEEVASIVGLKERKFQIGLQLAKRLFL